MERGCYIVNSAVPTEKTRITWIDIVKGFAILTVVFLHTHNGYDTSGKAVFYINKWITSFHMALFFVFAGYFFKIPNTLANIKKRMQKEGPKPAHSIYHMGMCDRIFRGKISGYCSEPELWAKLSSLFQDLSLAESFLWSYHGSCLF